jgi:hypothetical protein
MLRRFLFWWRYEAFASSQLAFGGQLQKELEQNAERNRTRTADREEPDREV